MKRKALASTLRVGTKFDILTSSTQSLNLTSSFFLASFFFSSSISFLSSWILFSSVWITSRRVRLSILPSRLPMAALVRVLTCDARQRRALRMRNLKQVLVYNFKAVKIHKKNVRLNYYYIAGLKQSLVNTKSFQKTKIQEAI